MRTTYHLPHPGGRSSRVPHIGLVLPRGNTQKEKEFPHTGGGRVFSLDASVGLLATASASALAMCFGSALSSCGVSCML